MLSPDDRARLRRALKEMVLSQLVDLLSDHPSDELADSTISFEAFLQTRGSNHPNAAVDASPKKARKQMVSVCGPMPISRPRNETHKPKATTRSCTGFLFFSHGGRWTTANPRSEPPCRAAHGTDEQCPCCEASCCPTAREHQYLPHRRRR